MPRVLNLKKESSEHFRWTHLEQVQHCIDLPRKVTFPAHTEQRKTKRLCEERARGNSYPREGQQPFRLNSNGVGKCTTTLRGVLIGAVSD